MLIGGISFILFVITLSLLLANKFTPGTCGCPHVVSNYFVYIFIVLAIIFVSCLLYYLFSLKMDTKENMITKNIEILFTILDEDEKRVIKQLAKNNGEMPQNEISKMFDKIRAHRIIRKLEAKGMISVSKQGKNNTIILNKDLKAELIR